MAINTVGCESGSLFAGANAANGSGATETVVVNEKIETATDDNYIAARATAAKDVTIEGARFKITADGGYGMNTDGSMYLPNLLLQVRDETTGWNAESRAGEHTNLSLSHAKSTVRGLVSCRLQ